MTHTTLLAAVALATAAPPALWLPPTGRLPGGTLLVAGLFTASGTLHLVRPTTFEALIPPALGDPTAWVLASGVAELACAGGLLTRARWAPAATAATLAAIWVGNLQMAVDVTRSPRTGPGAMAAAWVRLPLQVPLIRMAIRSPRRARH